MEVETTKPKQQRGFACMSAEKRIAIARKGGAAVKASNRSFSKNRELAEQAGRKGGMATRQVKPTSPAN